MNDTIIKLLTLAEELLAHEVQVQQEHCESLVDIAGTIVYPEDAAPELDSARSLVQDAIECIKAAPL
ncbi:hypothetical protein IT774_07540 [Salinimonas marina]|uniref:Uncharacterized protein n=1 Tax=Salinimonas marina TaxID=2785918 RepID=A0A7S9DZZ3_9ALTE|nr:hypothetical protein [Salinimonas marina]QPG06947.1 hypothetical protein IT774_07540 [Salinimonas marina]